MSNSLFRPLRLQFLFVQRGTWIEDQFFHTELLHSLEALPNQIWYKIMVFERRFHTHKTGRIPLFQLPKLLCSLPFESIWRRLVYFEDQAVNEVAEKEVEMRVACLRIWGEDHKFQLVPLLRLLAPLLTLAPCFVLSCSCSNSCTKWQHLQPKQ